MNDSFAAIYEWFFNYDYCLTLLDEMNNGKEYSKIFFLSLIINLSAVLLFYKVFNPSGKQRPKWFLLLAVNFLISFIISWGIINSNVEVMKYMENYSVDSNSISGDSFKFQMSILNGIYSLVLTLVFSIGSKFLSKVNKHNPF